MKLTVKNNSVGISARKVRGVAGLIRNKASSEALKILRFCDKREISLVVAKLINSALAAGEQKGNFNPAESFVKEIYVDEGPALKRVSPRAQGRAFRIKKRSSKITLTLSTKE